MQLSRLCEGIAGASLRGEDVPISGICVDSRNSRPGDLFAALRGWKTDGAGFVKDALSRGASALLVDRPLDLAAPQLVVPDVREALPKLCAAFYGNPQRQLEFWAVTGTNGKTTTTLLLRSVLEAAGRRTGILGTVFYGTPEHRRPSPMTTPDPPLLYEELDRMVRDRVRSVVMEVSSHALSQGRARGLSFGAAVFTNLTRDHLDYHETFEAYRDAKMILFKGLAPDAVAALNADDPSCGDFKKACACRVVEFGLSAGEVRGQVDQISLAGTRLSISLAGKKIPLHLRLVGLHNAANALAAAAAAHGRGIPAEAIRQGLEGCDPAPGRLERVRAPAPFTVLVDYAHTDDALRTALKAVRGLSPRRLIVVFGCGGDRDRGKRPLMARAAEEGADQVFLTSDNPRTEPPARILEDVCKGFKRPGSVHVIEDRREAIRAAVRCAGPGDCILIAGKGHEDYQVLGSRRIHFDDREEAAKALAAEGYGL